MGIPTEFRSQLDRRMLPSLAAGFLLACVGCEGSKSTSELIEQAKSNESADRTQAIRRLAERSAEAEAVVPVLAGALKDNDAFVRRDAARALGRVGPAAAAAVPALRTAVRDKNLHVRQAAKEALQKIAPDLPPEPRTR